MSPALRLRLCPVLLLLHFGLCAADVSTPGQAGIRGRGLIRVKRTHAVTGSNGRGRTKGLALTRDEAARGSNTQGHQVPQGHQGSQGSSTQKPQGPQGSNTQRSQGSRGSSTEGTGGYLAGIGGGGSTAGATNSLGLTATQIATSRRRKRKGSPKLGSSLVAYGSVGIDNNGGPVMRNPVHVYIVWMGSISQGQRNLIRSFIASCNSNSDPSNTVSQWWAINTMYYGGTLTGNVPSGGAISPKVTLSGEYSAPANATWGVLFEPAHGLLVLRDVAAVVRRALQVAPGWDPDPDGVYFVYTSSAIKQIKVGSSSDVSLSSCSTYCGWHNYFVSRDGVAIKYAWVGFLTCNACQADPFAYTTPRYAPPSLDSSTHSSLSIFAHELAESTSNPTFVSWYDNNGEENADKCQFRYGEVLSLIIGSSVAAYNLVGSNNVKFMIQQLWNPVTGRCVMTRT